MSTLMVGEYTVIKGFNLDRCIQGSGPATRSGCHCLPGSSGIGTILQAAASTAPSHTIRTMLTT